MSFFNHPSQNAQNSWNLHPRSWKCLKTCLFRFTARFLLFYTLKTEFSMRKFNFQQLSLQSLATFFSLTALFHLFCLKKLHFCVSKHFHGGVFNFHDINVQSSHLDLISNCFLKHLLMNCKKQRAFICKLILIWRFKVCD